MKKPPEGGWLRCESNTRCGKDYLINNFSGLWSRILSEETSSSPHVKWWETMESARHQRTIALTKMAAVEIARTSGSITDGAALFQTMIECIYEIPGGSSDEFRQETVALVKGWLGITTEQTT